MDHSDSCTCTCTRTAYDTSIFDNTAVHSDQHAPIPTHSAIILPSTNLSAPFNPQRQQQQQWLPSIASIRPDREDPTFRLDQRRRAFEELFLYACPKSIFETPPTPPPPYEDPEQLALSAEDLPLERTVPPHAVRHQRVHASDRADDPQLPQAHVHHTHFCLLLPKTLYLAINIINRFLSAVLCPQALPPPSRDTLLAINIINCFLSLHASCPHALPPPSRDTLPCHQHYGPFSLCTRHVHSPRALLPLPRDTLPCPSTLSSCASASSPRHLLTVSLCTCRVPCQVTVGWHHVYVSHCQG
jgi:hypothetical protein